MIATDVVFSKERAQDCFAEAWPLLYAHWKEIAHFKDIELQPDFTQYKILEDAGFLRTYVARVEGRMVGYVVYFVKNNIHYQFSKQAVQDIIFISRDYRGFGKKFILWCDEQLKAEQVQVVHHHVKEAANFGPMLERIGYEWVERVYSKRLDQ